jgi:hypothetical protein
LVVVVVVEIGVVEKSWNTPAAPWVSQAQKLGFQRKIWEGWWLLVIFFKREVWVENKETWLVDLGSEFQEDVRRQVRRTEWFWRLTPSDRWIGKEKMNRGMLIIVGYDRQTHSIVGDDCGWWYMVVSAYCVEGA